MASVRVLALPSRAPRRAPRPATTRAHVEDPPSPDQFFVFIARVIGSAHVGGRFAELEAVSSDSVARLAGRACTKFSHWGVAADQVELFLAAEEGEDAPSPESIEALLADPSKRLGEAWSLERARIRPGSWLLARVPPPPAAAPGASR